MSELAHSRALMLIPPTGAFCREDRCQSFFSPALVPWMRPPMEECEIAGALRAAGAKPYVIDAPALGLSAEASIDASIEVAPDLVILVVTFGTLSEDLAWAKRLRDRLPGVAIGVRGAPCFTQSDVILAAAPDVDFCVKGEYETIFASIARQGFRGTPGVRHRSSLDNARFEGERGPLATDLDLLPRPDRSTINPSLYNVRWLGRPQATVRVQRGCPFPCTYCLVHSVSGSTARHRSPQSVAEEMADVQSSGVDFFYLRAETFSLDRDWALETARAIEQHCPGARWVTTTRVELVDAELLDAMAASGCYGISFGIDAGSAETARRVKKPYDPARASQAMRLCDASGILSLGYFMVGFLWETEATLRETAAYIRRARPDLLTLHYAHPYPGTVYFDDVADAGIPIVSGHAQAELALEPQGADTELVRRHSRRMLRSHYANPLVAWSLARKATRLVAHLARSRKLGPVSAATPPSPGARGA